jgi:hypothetical protein
LSTSQDDWQKWFQDVWADREDRVYRGLFGSVGPRVHTIPPELFQQLGVAEPDPRWLVHGVFEIAPPARLPYWTYVTTALSNPWGEDPATVDHTAPSGLGFELLMHAPAAAPWAIQVLHWLMAVNIMAASGLLQGDTVCAGGRIPLHTGIDPQKPSSLIRNLLIVEATHLTPTFELPSGTVDLLLCLGVSDSEMRLAETLGYDEMLTKLSDAAVFPVTDPDRRPISG